jgi:hypothetical protein
MLSGGFENFNLFFRYDTSGVSIHPAIPFVLEFFMLNNNLCFFFVGLKHDQKLLENRSTLIHAYGQDRIHRAFQVW